MEAEEEFVQPKLRIITEYPIHRPVEEVDEEEKELLQTMKMENTTPELTHALESQIQAIRGGCHPLPKSERAFFEPRFGYDFTRVRVHSDAQAAESAQAVNARAYTVGQDVVFGAGQYTPGTTTGKKLLAHELTHVVQQGGRAVQSKNGEENTESTCIGWAANDTVGTLQTKLTLGTPNDIYEQEADRVARAYIHWERQTAVKDHEGSQLRRQEGEEEKKEQMMQVAGGSGQGSVRQKEMVVQRVDMDPETAMEEPLDPAHRGYEVYLPRLLQDSALGPATMRMMEHYAAGGLDGLYLPASRVEQIVQMGAFPPNLLNRMATDANNGVRSALSLASYEECKNSISSIEGAVHRGVMRLEAIRGIAGGGEAGNQAAAEAMGRWVRPRQDQPNSVYCIFRR